MLKQVRSFMTCSIKKCGSVCVCVINYDNNRSQLFAYTQISTAPICERLAMNKRRVSHVTNQYITWTCPFVMNKL